MARAHSDGQARWWKVKCDCGTEKLLRGGALLRSLRRINPCIKSCGCLWRERARCKRTGQGRLTTVDVALHDKFARYRVQAKNRGIAFELSLSVFKKLVQSACFYCGRPPSMTHACLYHGRTVGLCVYNGVDRLDNTETYTYSNCVAACWVCNNAKAQMNHTEFLSWIAAVASHNVVRLTAVQAAFPAYRHPKMAAFLRPPNRNQVSDVSASALHQTPCAK